MIEEVIKYVCEECHIRRDCLMGSAKFREYVAPRHLCWWLLNRRLGVRQADIARHFKKDHTAIGSGIRAYHKRFMDGKECPPLGTDKFIDGLLESSDTRKRLMVARWEEIDREMDRIFGRWKRILRKRFEENPAGTIARILEEDVAE